MSGHIPTDATLRAKQERILELVDTICPGVDASSPVDATEVALWEMEILIDNLIDDAKEIAVRRQGKVIMAAIRGDLTWSKGDDEGSWPDRSEADAEEDTLDAMERMMEPEEVTMLDAIERLHLDD